MVASCGQGPESSAQMQGKLMVLAVQRFKCQGPQVALEVWLWSRQLYHGRLMLVMEQRNNRVRDILVETCHRAHIGVQVEVGNNLTCDHTKSCPADILLPNWFLGRTVASTHLEAGVLAKTAAQSHRGKEIPGQ